MPVSPLPLHLQRSPFALAPQAERVGHPTYLVDRTCEHGDVKRVRVLVTGRVQGVFYRTTCVSRARQLGLAGSVRNLPDGRVEAVFEGRDEDVDVMVEWCRNGPDLARVDALEIVPEPLSGDPEFRVTG